MGDRCYMSLTVKSEQMDEVRSIFKEAGNNPSEFVMDNGQGFGFLGFEEVNYAKLEGIEAVQAAGIPFDLENTAGHDYEASTLYCRFTEEGTMQFQELCAEDEIVRLNDLLKIVDDHAALKALILQADADRQIIPWDNQVEYGKRYVARQLIQPEK